MLAHRKPVVGHRVPAKKDSFVEQFALRQPRRPSHALLACESLEGRNLLSVTATPEIQVESVTNNSVSGLTASETRTAYGFSSVSETGAGQTIAIVDSYNDPNIQSDLATFDSKMGLAAANLTVVNQSGGSSLPQTDPDWALEISLDVEWAHAIAPGANILLVEASSDNLNDLLTAVHYATTVSSVSVVSMSWGSSEFNGETSYDSYFTTPAGHQGITFVGASGDDGSPGIWPAMSTNVLAVGGTTLNVSSTGAYISEKAWNGSGGGTSPYESEPSWQQSVQSTGKREGPDVAYDADPNTGFAVYDSLADDGQSGWFQVGGTSDAAPQWAALLADANQGRAAAGEGTLNGAQAAIYTLPSSDFHDITSGSNGGYSAKAGYDEVTGRGTPIANLVINGLVSYSSSSGSSGSGSSGSGSSGSGSSGTGSSGSGSSGSGSSGSGSSGSGGSGSGSSGSSGSGSGSSGSGNSGSGNSGWGGWGHGRGGYGGYGGGYGGYYGGYGGRQDEIASSTSTADADSFVEAELALGIPASQTSLAGTASPGGIVSLAGIQQSSAMSATADAGLTSAATPQTAYQAAARPTAFASLSTDVSASEIDVSASASLSTPGSQIDSASLGDVRIAAAGNERAERVTGIASDSHGGTSATGTGAGDPDDWHSVMRDAVWSSLAIELDAPATLPDLAPPAAPPPGDNLAGAEPLSYGSPLAVAAAGLALGWIRQETVPQPREHTQPRERRLPRGPRC